VASTVVAGVTRGAPGALGAAIGVVGVAVSYVLSGLAVAWADAISPQLTMPVGLTTYAVKVVLLGVVLVGYGGRPRPGPHPTAGAAPDGVRDHRGGRRLERGALLVGDPREDPVRGDRAAVE